MGSGFNLFGAIGDAEPQHVLVGKKFSSENGTDLVGTIQNRTGHVNAQGVSYNSQSLRLRPPQGYFGGETNNSVQVSHNTITPSNIKAGVNFANSGLIGTLIEAKHAMGEGSHNAGQQLYDIRFNINVNSLSFRPKQVFIVVTQISWFRGIVTFGEYFAKEHSELKGRIDGTFTYTGGQIVIEGTPSITDNGFSCALYVSLHTGGRSNIDRLQVLTGYKWLCIG